jgi:hypothetical protein
MIVTACRMTPDHSWQQGAGLVEPREVGLVMIDLLALSAWLAEAGTTPVAMASTGA